MLLFLHVLVHLDGRFNSFLEIVSLNLGLGGLLVSLINRLNKAGSAVYNLWMCISSGSIFSLFNTNDSTASWVLVWFVLS